jgi:septum formation protein
LALILASGSPIRRQLLNAAGVDFEVVKPDLDEHAIKRDRSDPGEIAADLAAATAISVSGDRPGDWVIGSDSVVSVEGRLFDKPENREQAANHLHFFSGKPMILTSAVALARDGEIGWRFVDSAMLEIRPMSDGFIAEYLDAEWPGVGYCVGVFRMEGRGAQLFEKVAGDYFTILGMPLIPLLGALRERGLAPQ